MHQYPAYTVVFLAHHWPIERLLLLKRAPTKAFAPNRFTGVGGKVEAGETYLAGARRELAEETGLTTIQLSEFAHCLVNGESLLAYFVGLTTSATVPDCTEGTLAWHSIQTLGTLPSTPATSFVLHEWARREFATQPSWTVRLRHSGGLDGQIISAEVTEGLVRLTEEV